MNMIPEGIRRDALRREDWASYDKLRDWLRKELELEKDYRLASGGSKRINAVDTETSSGNDGQECTIEEELDNAIHALNNCNFELLMFGSENKAKVLV